MQLHSMHSVLHRMGRRATQPGSTQRLRAVLSKRPEQPHNGLSACRSSEMLTGHHDSRRKNQLLNQSNSKMVPLLFKLFYSVNFTASNFYKTKKSKRRTRLWSGNAVRRFVSRLYRLSCLTACIARGVTVLILLLTGGCPWWKEEGQHPSGVCVCVCVKFTM